MVLELLMVTLLSQLNLTSTFSTINTIEKSTSFEVNLDVLKRCSKKKEYVTLLILSNHDSILKEYASIELCRNLNPAQTMKFCENAEPGGAAWMVAIHALSKYKTPEVKTFYRIMAKKCKPQHRVHLYCIFDENKWPELSELAECDSESTYPYVLRNHPFGLPVPTVGDIATGYIRRSVNYRLEQ